MKDKQEQERRCPMVDRCAHPQGGRVGHRGRCVDCGHQVTETAPCGSPSARGGAVIAQVDYEGGVIA